MPPDPHNVRERLASATRVLATSAQPIQRRLATAGVQLAPLLSHEFAEPAARSAFTAIMDSLTTQGSVEATTAGMSDDQATAIAEQIVELDASYRPPFDVE